MEPRASLAAYNPATDELTLYVTSQNPHVHRLIMGAFVLGIPEHKFRVVSPDVGGGFGSKIFIYPEEVVVSWLARHSAGQSSGPRSAARVSSRTRMGATTRPMSRWASNAQGKIVGLRVHTVANVGAYLTLFAPAIPTYLYGTLLNGVYTIPTIYAEVDAVYTNTTPVECVPRRWASGSLLPPRAHDGRRRPHDAHRPG